MRFFSDYAETFGVKKGALLLYDSEREMFAPWAIEGFDVTTSHKLRIPLLTVSEQFSPLTEFRGDAGTAAFLRDHFSVREFDSIEELLIVPFHQDDSIIGLLLVAESDADYEQQTSFLLSNIDAISDFMFQSRELFYTKPSGTVYTADTAVAETESLIETARRKQKSLVVIRLDIGSTVEHLRRQLDRAEPYRLRKDVLSLISSMIRGSGKVIHTSDTHSLLIIETKSLTQARLLLHQIHHSLNSFFSLNDTLPLLSSSERVLSRDGETAEELLEGMI